MTYTKTFSGKTRLSVFQKLTLSVFIFALAYLSIGNSLAQTTRTVANRNYIKYENTWYLQWQTDTFRVDTSVITIKFNSSVTPIDISNFESANQLTKVRENQLKFIDYQIPSSTTVFDFVNNVCLTSTLIQSTDINTFGSFCSIPNDPGWQALEHNWPFNRINAPQAWDIATGCPNVIVSVIDAGFAYDHEDLGMGPDNYENIYHNPGEDAWTNPLDPTTGNGFDDDGNTLIDDWKGWNFDFNNNNPVPPIMADHAIMLAGIIGAKMNNNLGFASMAGGWGGPGVSLLNVKCAISSPNGGVVDDGIVYSYQMGAKIIILGLSMAPSTAIDAALQDAYVNHGVFIVTPSGNTGLPTLSYPASNPYTFSVGGTDYFDNKDGGAAYGPDLDIAAPNGPYFVFADPSSYIYPAGGTSCAAAFAAGTAALMYCINPCLTNVQVADIMRNTASKVGGYNYNYDPAHPGQSLELGYGRLDAYQAVLAAQQMYVAPPIVDLYSKDTPTDWGVEPNPNTGPMWISDDIWVRNIADGFINQVHQNPEYNINPLIDNFVYVRVRNKSCTASSPTDILRIYWAKAASALSWPNNWDGSVVCPAFPFPLMGDDNILPQLIPVIPPGGETILEFPWHVPNPSLYNGCNPEPWHFCLLSRIISINDPMTFTEVASVYDNARNNNNIVWKNLTVVDSLPGIAHNEDCWKDRQVGGVIAVGNPFNADDNYKLEFKLADAYRGVPITEQAEIKITLDDLTWQKWAAGGYQGENIKIKRNDCKQLIVTGNPASLKNLTYAAQERSTINLSFNFLTDKVDATPQFDYHVIQRRSQDDKIIGGELYQIRKPTRYLFGADAGGDKNISEGTTTTLTANSIGESAYYNWYDTDGNLIYSGNNFTVTPEITKKYKLEVIALSDGFASYDSVTVKIKDCEIQSITPNPATTQIVVQYKAQNVSSGYLVITHPSGTPNDNYILNLSQNTKTINVSNYAAGNYNLILICNGEIKDQKVLSIQ